MNRLRNYSKWKRPLLALATLVGLFLIPLILTTLVWAIALFFYWWWGAGSGHTWTQTVWVKFVERSVFPDGWFAPASYTGLFWIFFVLWGLAWWGVEYASHDSDRSTTYNPVTQRSEKQKVSRATKTVGVIGVLMAVLGSSLTVTQALQNDKQLGVYWNRSVEFVIKDPGKIPSALRYNTAAILDGNVQRMQEGSHCVYVRQADVPACITVGDLSMKWTERKASARTAFAKLSKTTDGSGNVLEPTLTYLYTNDGMWTGIRDGIGRLDLQAVVQWDGVGEATECKFAGDYAVKGSFRGDWSHNLPSTLAELYPGLFWDLSDAWGYCNGREPVVVLPVSRQIPFGDLSVPTYAGVLVIRGDHGKLRVYQVTNPSVGTDLERGQFPGPTYPATLTKAAREASSWAAGRVAHSGGMFGFEPTDHEAQQGNVSEYFMQNAQTGVLEWVTPLTLRRSDSQQFIAYSVTPATGGRDGQLNTTRIYVLQDDDPRVVNLPDLWASVKAAVLLWMPGFFSEKSSGELAEFLPVDEEHWQVYVELGQRVVARFDVPIDIRTRVNLTVLDSIVDLGLPGQQPGQNNNPDDPCSKEVTTLTTGELQTCVVQAHDRAQIFVDELARRAGSPNPSPSPSN